MWKSVEAYSRNDNEFQKGRNYFFELYYVSNFLFYSKSQIGTESKCYALKKWEELVFVKNI